MRPVVLEMTAFGSYARPTAVDFRRLEHDLYLITGDTGAGKTTIFEGIMMALYGEASGDGDKKPRIFEMMHCDYVDRSVDTTVRLTFEHMGKTHTVERTLHFQKARDTGEYTKALQRAELFEEGRDPIKNPRTVTGRIEELLGMDAAQFRKIVMLAQGEFKKFLDADSDEKNKILGQLFGNFVYVYYQELFDRARNKLEQRRREEGFNRIARAMEDFIQPEDLSGEEREVYTAGHSQLETALDRLAESDKESERSLGDEIRELQEQENHLREKSGRAGEQNKKLEELEKKKEEFRGLCEKRLDMERLREQTDRTDRAFHKVRPKEQLFGRTKKIWDDTEKEIRELEERLSQLEKERKNKKEALDRCREEDQPVIRQLEISLADIDRAIPQYDTLQRKSQELETEKGKAEEAGREKQKAEADGKQTADEIRELEKGIEELDGIEAETVRLKGVLERAEEKVRRLTGEGGVKEQAENIRIQEGELKEEKEKLQKLTAKAGQAEQVYHRLYQAFISGQAGVLAGELRRELKEKGEAVCPVCNTVFNSRESCHFAEMTEEPVQQKDVDRAKKDFEKKDKEREEQAGRTVKLETALEGKKSTAVRQMAELRPDCADWEILSGSGYLEEAIREYQEEKETAEKNYSDAEGKSGRLAGLKRQHSEKSRKLEKCEAARSQYGQAVQEHEKKIERLKAVIEQLKSTLAYPDRKTAEAQKKAWEDRKIELEGRLKKAEDEYKKAEGDHGKTAGALSNSREKLPGYKEEADREERAWQEEMRKQGFKSREEVREAVEKAGRTDAEVESWLSSNRDKIAEYGNQLENTKSRIRELDEETRGLEKTDMSRLEADISRLKERRESTGEKLDICRKKRENHQKTADIVREAGRLLESTEAAWRRLDDLADLAAGTRNTAGGKLSFDRYVMGYLFREVLEMANRRLDLMSGGRYELIHEVSVKRENAKAGLEISVLDMTTGKRRPSSSLSGGESFFVSLSLALGLSDVVQNHGGGKQMDVLFIDEGFGSLDSDVLDRALAVLNQLTQGQRLVGIISHVARLEESIPCQIRVRNSGKGSFLEQ